jgi:hypothetical protein
MIVIVPSNSGNFGSFKSKKSSNGIPLVREGVACNSQHVPVTLIFGIGNEYQILSQKHPKLGHEIYSYTYQNGCRQLQKESFQFLQIKINLQ